MKPYRQVVVVPADETCDDYTYEGANPTHQLVPLDAALIIERWGKLHEDDKGAWPEWAIMASIAAWHGAGYYEQALPKYRAEARQAVVKWLDALEAAAKAEAT